MASDPGSGAPELSSNINSLSNPFDNANDNEDSGAALSRGTHSTSSSNTHAALQLGAGLSQHTTRAGTCSLLGGKTDSAAANMKQLESTIRETLYAFTARLRHAHQKLRARVVAPGDTPTVNA